MFDEIQDRLRRLRRRYAEPHRHYHSQHHVDSLLFNMRNLADGAPGHAALELAAWYHDAVYDPAATDNEARSADLLDRDMAGLADPALLASAHAMVLATASHAPPEGPDPAPSAGVDLFLDLDLQVLGSLRDRYDAYETGIAAEFVPVHGEAAYRRGRAAFLEAMLARPRLYRTDRFHRLLDARARANMRRALDALAR